MNVCKDTRTATERKSDFAKMREIIQSATEDMDSDSEEKFIEESLSKIHVASRNDLRLRLIAVAGSDDLIRECVRDEGGSLLFQTQDCSNERVRQIIRSLRDGAYIHKKVALTIRTFNNDSVQLGRKLLGMIREEYSLNIYELRDGLGEDDGVVRYVLDEIYPDDV